MSWIPFSEHRPEPAYDKANPGPAHGYILVTNNVSARDRWGNPSHVWLVSMVHERADEITAFAGGHGPLRGLTHWRPALPEEWEEIDGRLACTSRRDYQQSAENRVIGNNA